MKFINILKKKIFKNFIFIFYYFRKLSFFINKYFILLFYYYYLIKVGTQLETRVHQDYQKLFLRFLNAILQNFQHN
jgi:hypothetical protein